MPRLGPIKRHDLITYLRRLGFSGPEYGRRHEIMTRGGVTVRLPNPHRGDIRTHLLVDILREAGISREEWDRL
jgi:hypothetical protein